MFVVFAVATGVVSVTRGGTGAEDASGKAFGVVQMVDRAEACGWKRDGRYSDNVVDLYTLSGEPIVPAVSRLGLELTLVAASDGRGYLVRVTGAGADQYLERHGRDIVASRLPGSPDGRCRVALG